MPVPDSLSIRVRLRITILALITLTVLGLSALHVREVIGGALAQAGARARIVGESLETLLLDLPQASISPSDRLMPRLLARSMEQDQTISNIQILDAGGKVVSAARSAPDVPFESWNDWQERGVLWRFFDLLRAQNDIALAINRQGGSPYTIRILFSPALLRAAVWPSLEEFGALCALSLAISVVLAVIVSSLVSDSLERLGRKIDRMAEGDLTLAKPESVEFPELATLESKLWWLGHQYSGARTDVLRLRHNIEMMLRQLDEAVLVFGPEGRLQMVGEEAERLLARSKEELLGRPLNTIFPEWTGPGAVLHQSAGSSHPVRDKPVTLIRSNLPPMKLLMTVEPIAYGDDTAPGMLVTFRNLETRQKIRSDLDTARRLAAISKIGAGVAHEIKNPLNAMMLHLQLAQDKAERGGDSRPELETVQRELLRLDRVVKTLLEFQRPLEPSLAECELNAITADVSALVRPQAEAQNMRVVLDTAADPIVVMLDSGLLTHALMNVAVNGIEAMDGGGVLHFSTGLVEDECYIAIRDTGTGIPPEIRDRIFNLYFTTKQTGAGAGLAMAYRIALLHSGSISVESEVGKGSCFRFRFPALVENRVSA